MFGITGTLLGIALMAIAALLIFIFPGPVNYQTDKFSITMIFAGILMAILGALLIFG